MFISIEKYWKDQIIEALSIERVSFQVALDSVLIFFPPVNYNTEIQ